MKAKELEELYSSVCHSIEKKKLKQALDTLKTLVAESGMGELSDKLQQLETTYENMLKYTLEGVADPERDKIYNSLQVSILELADHTREKILMDSSGWHTCMLKQELEKEQRLSGKSVVENIDDLSFKTQLDEVLKETAVDDPARQSFESGKHKEVISRIFSHLMLADNYKEAEKELIHTIIDDDRFRWYERSVFVSAISLSLLRCFDSEKFSALYRIFRLKEEEVWQRAFIGLVLAFYKYDIRVPLYPELTNIIKELEDEEGMEKELEQVLIQLIRSGDTESISKKIQEEIVPEMVKLAPKLTDKLELDELLPEKLAEDQNPDWENLFRESEGLYEKVEEFSKMQLEGADVFMSAFSQLKQFSFFSEISNWFLPFVPENPVIDETFSFKDDQFDREGFLSGLESTAYMCNSDKYSFCLNVKLMPEAQRSMLLKMFQSELEGMKEMQKSDQLVEEDKTSRTIYTQYIHDLYRFVKLYRHKNEFHDPFKTSLDFYNTFLFKRLAGGDDLLYSIAEYYFQNGHYPRAIEIFTRLAENNEKIELLEKIAYSYQMLKNFEKALEYYSKAEIYDSDKEWLLKKTAFCYRKLQEPEKALKYYQRCEALDPDNLFTQASIGHCYLDLKEYDKALKYYFKVEYLDPSNKKVWRPLAWCCLSTAKFSQAEKYYKQIFEAGSKSYDLINMGHLELCRGNKLEAAELYKQSIKHKDGALELFLESFDSDRELLLKHGVPEKDLPILLDHVQYSLAN